MATLILMCLLPVARPVSTNMTTPMYMAAVTTTATMANAKLSDVCELCHMTCTLTNSMSRLISMATCNGTLNICITLTAHCMDCSRVLCMQHSHINLITQYTGNRHISMSAASHTRTHTLYTIDMLSICMLHKPAGTSSSASWLTHHSTYCHATGMFKLTNPKSAVMNSYTTWFL